MPKLIDTHCHLDFDVFSADFDSVMENAASNLVEAMILPATTAQRWDQVRQIATSYRNIYPAYGLHPCFMAEHGEHDIELLDNRLRSEPAIAVGECGLDFYHKNSHRKAQITLFESQLELAKKHQLPAIIHARKSVEDIIRLLKTQPGVQCVLHSYSGSYEQACQLMDLGCYFGFGGPVTWTGSTRLQAMVKKIPLEFILLETDSPDQADQTHRRERNEPGFLPAIAVFLSQLRQESLEKIALQTSQNARILFSIE